MNRLKLKILSSALAVIAIFTLASATQVLAIRGITNSSQGTGLTNTQPATNGAGAASGSPKEILRFNSKVSDTSIQSIISRVINILLGVIGSVSIIFIIIGGFRLIASQCDSSTGKMRQC